MILANNDKAFYAVCICLASFLLWIAGRNGDDFGAALIALWLVACVGCLATEK